MATEDSTSYELMDAAAAEEEENEEDDYVYTYSATVDDDDDDDNDEPLVLDDGDVAKENEVGASSYQSRNNNTHEKDPEAESVDFKSQQVVFELPDSLHNHLEGNTVPKSSSHQSRNQQQQVVDDDDNVSIVSDSYASSTFLHALSTIQLEPDHLEPQGSVPVLNVVSPLPPTTTTKSKNIKHDRHSTTLQLVAPTTTAPRNLEGDDPSDSWTTTMRSVRTPPNNNSTRNSISGGQRSERYNDDDWTSATYTIQDESSTIISGFEYISLDGKSQLLRRCKRCTLLNQDVDGWCDGCGLALIVNPCYEIDQQIAVNLRQKEEREAYESLQQQEKKHHLLADQPLLVQSHALADAIQNYVTQFLRRNPGNGIILSVPTTHMVLLASRMIEFMLQPCRPLYRTTAATVHRAAPPPRTVQVAYCFTKKEAGANEVIHREGFPLHTKYSTNIKAAYHSAKDYYYCTNDTSSLTLARGQTTSQRDARRNQRRLHEVITVVDEDQESQNKCEKKEEKESNLLGWIALTTASDNDTYTSWKDSTHENKTTNENDKNDGDNDGYVMNNAHHTYNKVGDNKKKSKEASSSDTNRSNNDNIKSSNKEEDFAVVTSLSERCQSVPLVCFDATLRNHDDIMRRLVRGLQFTFDEFFYPYQAKRKIRDCDNNGNVADAIVVVQTKRLKVASTTNSRDMAAVPTPAVPTPAPLMQQRSSLKRTPTLRRNSYNF